MVCLISIKSLQNYILINGTLFFITFFNYYLIQNYYYLTYFSLLSKNYFIINFIDYSTKYKKNIKEPKINKSIINYQDNLNVFNVTFIQTVNLYLTHFYLNENINYNFDIITFIPVSFLYEIIFDFFHYCIHRFCHVDTLLYSIIHKKHHKNYILTSILTFDQTMLDFILTDAFPEIITLFIFQTFFFKFTFFQFFLILNYKTFFEVASHSGKYTNSCGFVQCIWLPRFFNIELATEDHDLHHKLIVCNYSKRFSLWDKVFKTYKSSIKK